MELFESIIRPIYTGEGYNAVNTVFVVLVFYASVSLIWKYARRIDWSPRNWGRFVPAIVFGVLVRVMKDAGKVPVALSPLFVTPFVWIEVAVLMIALNEIDKRAGTNLLFHLPLVLSVPMIISLNPDMGRLFPYLAAGVAAMMMGRLAAHAGAEGLSFSAQMFDAFTTAIALENGFFEEQVVARAVTSAMGPWSMFILKIPVLALLYYIIKKEMKGNEQGFAHFLIFVVGLGPGIRNMVLFLLS